MYSDFGPQMRRLNSETMSVCGGIWGGFLRIARRFEFRKRNSIEIFSMGATVEVDNQRNCLVMCLDQNGGVCDNKLITHMNILRVRVHYPYPYTDIGVS